MTLFDAACELGAKVGPVMPVVGKRPTQPDWPNTATRTPIDGPEWRAATGIGLLTGARAGYFVLDVDGARGAASLAALEAQHGALPTTWVSRTGGGGMHFFFRWPSFVVRGSAGKLGPGLDVRGEGGQVVVPPSAHPSGTTYEWQLAPWALQPPPDAPAWLLDLLRPKPELVSVPSPRLSDGSDVLKRASAYLAKIPGAIEGSGGSNDAWKAALAVVRGFALSESDAYALLAAEYNPRCTPPWSEKELRHKVKDASQKASVTWGYLRDAERPSKVLGALSPPVREEPGCDDGDDAPVDLGIVDEGVSEFFATAADKIPWLLEPVIPKGAFVLVQGGPKSGKTWFGAWLACECAQAGYKVAVVEEEGSREVLRDRLKPFLVDPPAWNGSLRVMYKKRIRLDDPVTLSKLCDKYRGFDLIVLDPFIRLHGGKEKESDEMAVVLRAVQTLMHETGAAVVLIHHTKKNDSWLRSSTTAAGLDDGRGSGVIAGEADNIIAIRGVAFEDRQPGQVRFYVENPGSRISAEFDKRLAVVDLTADPAHAFTWTEENQKGPDSRVVADVLAFITAAGAAGTSKNRIEAGVTGDVLKVRAALRGLRDSKTVEEFPHGAYTRWRVR